jgi:hypothetical protein
MKTYRRFNASSHPVYASLDAQDCWLEANPIPQVIASESFWAILLSEAPGDHLTRSYELGRADQYYSCICRGIDDKDMINLYSSEQQARDNYTDALTRYDNDSRWQRV